MSGSPAVWAPYASDVELVTPDGRTRMQRVGGGWWRCEVARCDGERHAFSLDGGQPRPDPRGLALPDGPHGSSAWYDPAGFEWTDAGWRGVPLEGSVLYETHVGTFTPDGTLDAASERLPYLADLGVDVVELLPLGCFPGRHGWGYDGVAPYSVHEAYGGPAALQRFVDAAHGHGLGVCLDVVYNHLGPDGNYLAEFGPYFTQLHATPWGTAVNYDDSGSDEVRRWVLDNVRQWLEAFHVDGLRLDAVHEYHDGSATPLLEAMSREVDELAAATGRTLWLVAESDRNDPRTVTPRGAGAAVAGLGVHGQWADDVHHATHVALTGERQGYYADFAGPDALPKVMGTPFFHDGGHSSFRGRRHGRAVDPQTVPGWRFVVSLQTHDQVGNRAQGDRLSMLVEPGLLACGAAILLTSPYTPMLFMGEEWGAATPWQFFTDHTDPDIARATRDGRRREFGAHGWDESEIPDPQDPETFRRSRLDWAEPEREPHPRLLGWYRALLAARRAHLDLRDPRLGEGRASWTDRVLRVRRGAFLVVANLSDRSCTAEASGVLLSWDPGVEARDGQAVVPARSAAVLLADESGMVGAMEEPLADRYRRLAAAMTARIAGVPDDAWPAPTPCEGWTVRDLVAHLVDVHGRFQALVGRQAVEHPSVDADPVGAWAAVRDQMQSDLEDPAKVGEEYEGRLGRSTFGKAVDGFVCFDLVVHGWDLARATGQDETIGAGDVERVQAAVDAMGQVMRSNGVIAEPVDPGPDAGAQDRLLGALGRRP